MVRMTVLFVLTALSVLPVRAFAGPDSWYWKLENLERYVYPSDMEHLNWHEIRAQREQRKTAHMEPKVLTLSPTGPEDLALPSSVNVSVMDPDGRISDYHGTTVTLPEDMNLIGRYLLASSVPRGTIEDPQSGKAMSAVHCNKGLVTHHKNGGRVGKTSVVFWDDPERLPLEIGPVLDTAKSRYCGGLQRTHREYEMMVKYKSRPLPGATVTVSALDSGWSNTLTTDSEGMFTVMPTDDRLNDNDFQTYVYTARHHDPDQNVMYVATFPVMIYKNRPEWRSKAMGFITWAIVGTGLTLLIIVGYLKRKSWENRRFLVIFENHRIKE